MPAARVSYRVIIFCYVFGFHIVGFTPVNVRTSRQEITHYSTWHLLAAHTCCRVSRLETGGARGDIAAAMAEGLASFLEEFRTLTNSGISDSAIPSTGRYGREHFSDQGLPGNDNSSDKDGYELLLFSTILVNRHACT